MCRICDRFWQLFWQHSSDWEMKESNEDVLLADESDENWDLMQRASALDESDPEAAFQLYLQAATQGSIWSMEAVGWRYWTGTGTIADMQKAQQYYRRAIAGGSLIAQINCARLLAANDQHSEAVKILEQGASSDFVTAFFWLARLRYDRDASTEVANEIRPMLKRAVQKGHPGAQQLLSKLMLKGKFGFLAIPTGLQLALSGAFSFAVAHPGWSK